MLIRGVLPCPWLAPLVIALAMLVHCAVSRPGVELHDDLGVPQRLQDTEDAQTGTARPVWHAMDVSRPQNQSRTLLQAPTDDAAVFNPNATSSPSVGAATPPYVASPEFVATFEPLNLTVGEVAPWNASIADSNATAASPDVVAASKAPPDSSPAPLASLAGAAVAVCPAAVDQPPPNLANQQALKSCPMVVAHLVQGRAAGRGQPTVCSTVLLQNNRPELTFGWQLVWRSSTPPNPLLVTAIAGAEMVSASGSYRVVNSAAAPDIDPAGGYANFTLQHAPRSGNNAAGTSSTPQTLANASLDWSGVFINGQYCSKIPSRSFLLDDCRDIWYGLLKSSTDKVQCTSIFCCGDLDVPDQQTVVNPSPDDDPPLVLSPVPAPAPSNGPGSKLHTTPEGSKGTGSDLGPLATLGTPARPTDAPAAGANGNSPAVQASTNPGTPVQTDQGADKPDDTGDRPALAAIVVPSVVGSLVLAALMAAMWAVQTKRRAKQQSGTSQGDQLSGAGACDADKAPVTGTDGKPGAHHPQPPGVNDTPGKLGPANASLIVNPGYQETYGGMHDGVQGVGGTAHVLAGPNSAPMYLRKSYDTAGAASISSTNTTLFTHGSGVSGVVYRQQAGCPASLEPAGPTAAGTASQLHSAAMSQFSSYASSRNATGSTRRGDITLVSHHSGSYVRTGGSTNSHEGQALELNAAGQLLGPVMNHHRPEPESGGVQRYPSSGLSMTQANHNPTTTSSNTPYPLPSNTPYLPSRPSNHLLYTRPNQPSTYSMTNTLMYADSGSAAARDVQPAVQQYHHHLPSTLSAPAPRIHHLLAGPGATTTLQPSLSDALSSSQPGQGIDNAADNMSDTWRMYEQYVDGAASRQRQVADAVCGLPLSSFITAAQQGPLHAGLLESDQPQQQQAELFVAPALLSYTPNASAQLRDWLPAVSIDQVAQPQHTVFQATRANSWHQGRLSQMSSRTLIGHKSDPAQLRCFGLPALPTDSQATLSSRQSTESQPRLYDDPKRDESKHPLLMVQSRADASGDVHPLDTPWTSAERPPRAAASQVAPQASADATSSSRARGRSELPRVQQTQTGGMVPAAQPGADTGASSARRWAAIDFSKDIVLTRKLGSGAFGTVYEAVWRDAPASARVLLHDTLCHPHSGADVAVAIKVVPLMVDTGNYNPRSLDALKQEIQVLSRLSHPHVVRFLGACLAPPNVCIVEELAAGGSLHAALHHSGRPHAARNVLGITSEADMLPISEVLRLGAEVAGAMAYLHSLKVVHRDLKAANVLLDAHGRAMVADFGIAKFRDSTCLSTRNVHAGTPAYMAPEQFEGRPVSERVDQFAFGVLLWECLTRQLPWPDLDHPMQIIFVVGVQGERLPLPSHCPPQLASLISRCWSDEPSERPSFESLHRELRSLSQELAT